MAATIHTIRNDPTQNVHASLYPRALMTELEFKENRYPTISSTSYQTAQRSSGPFGGPSDLLLRDGTSRATSPSRKSYEPSGPGNVSPSLNPAGEQSHQDSRSLQPDQISGLLPSDMQSLRSQPSQSQEPPRSVLSYALPPGGARRVVERYSLDDNPQRQRSSSRASIDTPPIAPDTGAEVIRSKAATPQSLPQDYPLSYITSTPRQTLLPISGTSASSPIVANNAEFSNAYMPLSASPGFSAPIASNLRAYPQQPTYINPPTTPKPITTVYTQAVPPEEVCVECAMRDQDMADVDVTSPGVWERESDVLFDELVRREREEEMAGVVNVDELRPRSKGGKLTEKNLKIWLSVNPREPASRQQTLSTYIKAQRALLEAEALAHACAMQEAKQLDNRMRDAYSQLRRSAYDTGNSSGAGDDGGGLRIKAPQSPITPSTPHNKGHSREVTLLENGMIVEHVDVRKEEREARERKRKEERRARKSSRGSGIDVTSLISAQSYATPTDAGLKPYSRYSQSSAARPTSVLTAPLDRPELPRAYSQASFSDVHSMGSASPRKMRFFGIKNFNNGWRSQDSLAPSGMSGSMMDMHVVLQREALTNQYPQSPINLNTPRRSQIWPPDVESPDTRAATPQEEKPKKKRTGFAKIWRIVTGSSKADSTRTRTTSTSYDRNEDDLPLAPPPPLSYLVDRTRSNELMLNGRAHASQPSLPTSPRLGNSSSGMSPPTAPSSVLPSPTSSRPPGQDFDINIEIRREGGRPDDQEVDDTIGKAQTYSKNLLSMTSEPDMRFRTSRNLSSPPPLPSPNLSRLSREKSLPPLPDEIRPRTLTSVVDTRPRTVYTYEPNTLPSPSTRLNGASPTGPFRGADFRRQSFGGLSTRPNFNSQALPASPKLLTNDSRQLLSPRYDEFGLSRRSLGRLDYVVEQSQPPASTKRKSKFGLASMFGKKPHLNERDSSATDGATHQFPTMRRSGSDQQDEFNNNGYATSTSRHSALSMAGPPGGRVSMVSRKPLEELVAQDPDFVAYRYPSNDQRLDLLRR